MLQQTSRAALDIMSSEMVMAGFGQRAPGTAEDESQVVFSAASTLGGASASDSVRFIANLGPSVMVMVDTPLDSFTRQDAGAQLWDDDINLNNVDATDDGYEFATSFTENMEVAIMTLSRELMGYGFVYSPGSVPAGKIAVHDITWQGEWAVTNPTQIDGGTIVMQRPLWITYRIMDVDGVPSLVRCAYKTQEAECDLDDLNSANPNESVYVLAPYAEDLQFSYMLEEEPSAVSSSPAVFHPLPGEGDFQLDMTTRNAIRGVKIELLIRSSDFDPSIDPENCKAGVERRNFYLGDRGLAADETSCRYARIKMSTIVYLPNMAGVPHQKGA